MGLVAAQRTDELRLTAKGMGFTHVGCTPAVTLESEGRLLHEWLRRGYYAGMQYMERNSEKRIDVTTIVPGAKSVIALAYNYFHPATIPTEDSIGKISRYAWGEDYHEVIRPKLATLEELLRQFDASAVTKSYVDTGPVMEKAWAARAGIGWMGKHTNIITRDLGSWIFLATMITTVEFLYDQPIEDYCGTCTACIDACPTQAITEPYVVDANKCISYLTIELKDDETPNGENSDFQNWIFGCDICQDVCPWNSFATPTADEAFTPRNHNREMELGNVLKMEDEEFRLLFRNSPVKRTKLAGLKRNARTILAQQHVHSRKNKTTLEKT